MCIHLWKFFQVHRWTRLDVIPENPKINWKLALYLPVCSSKLFFTPLLKPLEFNIDVNLFGLYQDQWTLETRS